MVLDPQLLISLCEEHSDLEKADIELISQISRSLGSIADLMEADVFIDCRTRDQDMAIVVAQARPLNLQLLYSGSVVGQFAHRSNEPAVLRTLEVGMKTIDMRGVTQENKNVRQSVSPIKNPADEVIGALIAEKDITARVQAVKKLSVLTRTTEQLVERAAYSKVGSESLPYHVTDGVLIFDLSGICAYANPVAERFYRNLGYIDQLEGLSFENMTFHGVKFEEVLREKEILHKGLEIGNYNFDIKYTFIKSKKEAFARVVMLINDVTDVKNKEKELVLKAVAISEIHHRVKNNLQTIASLLKLQSRRVADPAAKRAFDESISQVLSIAATHEILAEDGKDDVDIMTMLEKIKASTIQHDLLASKGVVINLIGETFMCDSDMATSIALVVNEVTQNSLKYAFDGRDSGKVDIEICNGEIYSNISISDDGVGFDLEKEGTGTLGLNIIRRIVTEKLRGNLTLESNDRGTKVFFDFPLTSVAEKLM